MQRKFLVLKLIATVLSLCLIWPSVASAARPHNLRAASKTRPTWLSGTLAHFRKPLPKPRFVNRRLTQVHMPALNDLVIYFRQRGVRAYRAGRYKEAAVHLRKALDLKPDDRMARVWMLKLQGVAKQR